MGPAYPGRAAHHDTRLPGTRAVGPLVAPAHRPSIRHLGAGGLQEGLVPASNRAKA